MNRDAPFGGYKLSGIGRDGGRYALNAYSELKYIGWTLTLEPDAEIDAETPRSGLRSA